ncbi:DNA cytosine methyltransferase [Acrocarpospora pleiomorpha]|uniref:DNA cytosine methyltransferase n=1 Tax=Acrocarpospora pleiomorpha TaxID=90975 RepID=UPI001FEA56E4|nr:DNA (cytosine-5-)-methyltransferase [Acrocarpospora pleiomorpha]
MTLARGPMVEPQQIDHAPAVAEFFAGIGLVRIGLERAGFKVAWANDIERDKKQMYEGHFKDKKDHYFCRDIAEVRIAKIPRVALAWASFPCIDVSLAGWRRGLNGEHTGTFWQFIRVLKEMREENRLPPVVALENVSGLATSHGGQDLVDAVAALNELGYSVDVLSLDARHFVPQSRPRLFLVGALEPPESTSVDDPVLRPARIRPIFENPALRTHQAVLPKLGELRSSGLLDYVDVIAADDPLWWDENRTAAFLGSLSPIQRTRLDELIASENTVYRTAYRRTRQGKPTWEIRADEISGCLRTARGGSSKQALVKVTGKTVQVRWMTGSEYGKLMGAEGYDLSRLRRNQALFGFGDAVCVDVVAWLAEHYLYPLVQQASRPAVDLVEALAG